MTPRVSIGLPVHNGMPLLERSLTSLLEQDMADIEIVVSDNASDDGTEAFCRDVASRDKRLRYNRNGENIGAAANFERAFQLARAPYFAWAAHDDRYEPSFMSSCLAELERHPGSAMCVPAHRRVDENGRLVSVRLEPAGLSSSDLETRLKAHLWRRGWLTIYGLWRREALNWIGTPPPVFGSDVVVVWKALLLSPIATLPLPLADYLVVRGKRADSVMSGIVGAPSRVHFAHSGMLKSLRQSVADLTLSQDDRRIAERVLRRWVLTRHYRELIATDLIEEHRRMKAEGATLRAWTVLPPAGLLSPRMAMRGALHALPKRSSGSR